MTSVSPVCPERVSQPAHDDRSGVGAIAQPVEPHGVFVGICPDDCLQQPVVAVAPGPVREVHFIVKLYNTGRSFAATRFEQQRSRSEFRHRAYPAFRPCRWNGRKADRSVGGVEIELVGAQLDQFRPVQGNRHAHLVKGCTMCVEEFHVDAEPGQDQVDGVSAYQVSPEIEIGFGSLVCLGLL
ncbi:hypothetical protein OEG86_08055 [Hoeflea alexandrii]|uniref:hypothetical protein n=1 Tax=Hoeflea alexandrii TaxID=288436 RepID=UPI00226E672D|nr:hypothetical protein [Hoeflea alexandrii]MCY0152200.1 hypothetical protein [Hoeflea alexandrii]